MTDTSTEQEDIGTRAESWDCGETEAEREILRKVHALAVAITDKTSKASASAEVQEISNAAETPEAKTRIRNAWNHGYRVAYRREHAGEITWKEMREGFVYIGAQKRFVRLSDGFIWDVDAFQKQFGYVLKDIKVRTVDEEGAETLVPTKAKSLTGYIFSQKPFPSPGLKTFDTFGFLPGGEYSNIRGVFNQWRPSDVIPKKGDTSRWDAHLKYLFENDDVRERVLDWYSWVYCNQDKHPDCALMIQGEIQGTGKSLLNLIMHRLLIGTPVAPITERMLTADHETWPLRTKLAILEIRSASPKLMARLHDLITGPSISVDMKNAPDFHLPNVVAYASEANPKNALAGIDNSDRRWEIASTDQGDKLLEPRDEREYYEPLYSHFNLGKMDKRKDNPESLAAIAYALKERNGGRYHGGRAIGSTAKVEMMAAGAGELDKWMIEHAAAGGLPFARSTFTIEEVVVVVPNDIKHGKMRDGNLRDAIVTVLKDKLAAENVGQVRIGGRTIAASIADRTRTEATTRPRLWALHGQVGGVIHEAKPFRDRYTDAELAKRYRNERAIFTAPDAAAIKAAKKAFDAFWNEHPEVAPVDVAAEFPADDGDEWLTG